MTDKHHLLALDQGTSSSRSIVFDARRPHRRDGAARVPPDLPAARLGRARPARDLELAAGDGARGAAAGRPRRGRHRRASASPTSARRRFVWNRATGEPIGNAIVWQDRRTAPACDALKARGLEPLFREKTGLVLDAYFSGTKLAWLLDHVPGARAAAERGELAFGTVDTWLMWLLLIAIKMKI